MIGRETRVLLRHYLEQGRSKEALARELGISRRAIYHWIQTGQWDRDLDDGAVHYWARPPVPTKLDPIAQAHTVLDLLEDVGRQATKC